MKAILIFALAGISTFGIAACGDSSSGSGSRTGFGSSSGSGGTGSGGSGGSGGTAAVGGGSQAGDQTGAGPGAPSTGVDPGSNGLPNDPNTPCNDISNDGTSVSSQSAGSSMPSGSGGPQPLDGHYLLTQVQRFGSTGGGTYQGTVFISSGIFQFVVNKNGTETRTSYGVAYADPNITLTGRCGDSSTLNYTYTAPSETQITLYDATNKIAYTYTRPDPADVDGGV